MSKALDLANDLSSFEPKYDAGTIDAVTLTNSVVDAGQLLGIDLSGLANAGDYISVNVTNATDGQLLFFSSGALVNQSASTIDHDALTNFVANEHIDWTSTSSNFSTTGTFSSGDITATNLNVSTGTISTNGTERISNGGVLSNVTAAASIITSGTFADAQISASSVTQHLSGYQTTLVSGTDIKTINNTSLLGSGNITITSGATSLNGLSDVTVTGSEPAGEPLVSNGSGGFSPDPLTPLMLAIALG